MRSAMPSSCTLPAALPGVTRCDLQITVESDAHALVTTPGAAKWYKANGRTASQRVHLDVRGVLEWLPQESDRLRCGRRPFRRSISISRADAAMIGWDVVALGRRAGGERFEHGRYAQSIRV